MALDVTTADFEREVIARSRQTPVVVDFWAGWCGPCRVLGPTLERAVDQRPDVVLAKVDVDSNQELARRYGIQGIPAVKAFRDGEVVDEFVGAQPAAEVERFLDRVVPSEADALVAEGDEQSLRRALELDPGRADAAAALGRLMLERGDSAAALELLDEVTGDFVVEGLAARASLALDGSTERGPEVSRGLEALGAGRLEEALEQLASAIDGLDGETRELVRKVMVGVFTELGADHPLSTTFRPRLAAALY